ncbi:MAG TPA: MarR family winged helix-turn-helix transcriptional regulator [Spirochaetia bacterium]|nr:MarR family winged helix-turn-helix transcriptional regulator [Spirochaetia bacterium]
MAQQEAKANPTADLLWDLLRSVHRISHPVKKGEVTVQQFILLKALNWHGEQRVGELARRVGLTQSSVSIAIKRLEKEGLVARERDPADERRVSLALTATGQAVLRNWQEKWTQAMTAFLNRLNAGEQDQLHLLLQKMLERDNGPEGERY